MQAGKLTTYDAALPVVEVTSDAAGRVKVAGSQEVIEAGFRDSESHANIEL
jgi:hypothetical protein